MRHGVMIAAFFPTCEKPALCNDNFGALHAALVSEEFGYPARFREGELRFGLTKAV